MTSEHTEKKGVETVLKSLKLDMDRMNSQMAKLDKDAETLKSGLVVSEKEFIARLKAIEIAATEMEGNILEIEENRNAVRAEVVEAEKQIMLWQRKIHLEQEMQKALDPSVGDLESTAMKREIHRMRLRLEQLKRRQETIIVEMERAVHKKAAIQLKYEPSAALSRGQDKKREIAGIKRSLKTSADARVGAEEAIVKKEAGLGELEEVIRGASEEGNKLEQMTVDLKANISVTKVVTEINHAKILKTQKRVESFVAGGGNLNSNALEEEIEKQKKLNTMVGYFRDRFTDVEVFHPQLWASFYEK